MTLDNTVRHRIDGLEKFEAEIKRMQAVRHRIDGLEKLALQHSITPQSSPSHRWFRNSHTVKAKYEKSSPSHRWFRNET